VSSTTDVRWSPSICMTDRTVVPMLRRTASARPLSSASPTHVNQWDEDTAGVPSGTRP
jgi:hypothetical protein